MVTDTAHTRSVEVDDSTREEPRAATPAPGAAARVRRRRIAIHGPSVMVLAIGLVITLVLSVGAAVLNQRNEDRLLRQRAKEVGLVLSVSTSTTQVPLQAMALVAEATSGSAAGFTAAMKPFVTPTKDARYVSASLWRIDRNPPVVVTNLGAQPQLARESPQAISDFFKHTNGRVLSVRDLLDANPRRIAYAMTSPGSSPHFAVYTETELPKNRQAKIAKDSAFSGLDYALYLGTKADDRKLVASQSGHGVSGGHTASATSPLGNTSVLIVVKAQEQLGGGLLLRLSWILAIFGVLLSAGATLLAERLIRGREAAEALAGELDVVATENARLYNEQRSVARTLQHMLLPSALPQVGFELAARYVAGEIDVEVGGDWYDVIPVADNRVMFVIGDVSGRGIPAATVMASLRYAVRAYATQGDAPDEILRKLADLLSLTSDGHFATVLCGRVDLANRTLEVANAGHLDPLLVSNRAASYLRTRVGVPIGAMSAPHYQLTTIELPATGTLLLYTDGLIERRGESLDVGFTRLARAAEKEADAPVDVLLERVVTDLIPGGASDDTALLGLRWKT